MTITDEAYHAAAVYRHKIAHILSDAVRRFEGNNVTWAHAGIYANEMKQILPPTVPGPNYKDILEEGLAQLRALVNVK